MRILTRRQLLAGGSAAASMAAAGRKPNVVLIMTDDQGYGDLSVHGNTMLRTPAIDRFAGQSAEFTRFTVSPVCAPTRAALLTGRYPMRCGVHGVTFGRETIRRDEVTLGRAFQQAGYKTALFGKWHLGENYPHVPHAMGFDEFVGFRPGHWNRYFDSPMERNGRPLRLDGYVTDALTRHALRFIDENRERPFFLYLPLNAPHAPYQVPDKYFDRFAAKGLTPELAAIHGMVENIDENIGRILSRLEQLRLSGDTIVVFLCDNGPQTDRYVSGFRGRKGQVYEGGTRSPFFIRWPGHIPAGRKFDAIAAHIDVLPTLLDLCGVGLPAGRRIDGISLAPVMRGDTPADRIIFSHADHQPDPTQPFPGAARSQRFKMVNGAELYDLMTDPGEKTNIAASHPEELDRLNREYRRWFLSTLEGFRVGHPPIPIGYWEENPATLSAPQSELAGGLRFFARNGFANDFLSGFENPEAAASWEIEASSGGRYELSVEYVGSAQPTVALSMESQSIEARVEAPASATPNRLPERSAGRTANTAPDLNWKLQRIGRLSIEPGRHTIRLQVQPAVGKDSLFIKSVQIRRLR